uniref:TF-B3 domain-containing protein n=1 Tax=Populus trichocarpa TaxID=3694 RepID=A0A2K1ZFX4_POPTR
MEEDSESAVGLGGEVVEIDDGLHEEQMNTENKEHNLNNHDPGHNRKPTKLFSKSLSRTDIEVRLSAPTRCLRFFPELEGKSAIESQAIDALGKQWSFKLSVGRGGIHHKPVITGQWP